jgi:RNA polymerase sigma factor (sigma-70 family)
MATRAAQLVGHLRRLAAPSGDADADAVLLERYIQQRDEAAFSALVGRYGPMVLLVCRRILADRHAAEDCLQATFLVLARKAASIRRQHSLAAFLHAVACRVARKARAARWRQKVEAGSEEDPADPHPDPLSALTARELMTAVDLEVERLPEVYRLPVVLCCLEGLSQEEAARRLGWTAGSVKGRLERGRKQLHDRLARRGLSLSAALAAVLVSRAGTVLGAGTTGAALALVTGRGAAKTAPLARAAALAEGELAGTGVLVRLAVAAVLAAGVAGAALLVYPRAPGPAAVAPPGIGERAQARADQDEPLPPGAVARMGSGRFCPGTTVESVAFSPDRKTLATGNAYGTVSLWEIATGKEIRQLRLRNGHVMTVAFSPGGSLLAARAYDSDIYLWEAATGKLVRRIAVPPARFPAGWSGSTTWAFRIAFSPDGKVLAAAPGDVTGHDSKIILYGVASGKELRRLGGGQGPVRAFAFAPDGKSLAVTAGDRTVGVWQPSTGKQLRLLSGGKESPAALAYSGDGKSLALGGGREIRLWSVATGKEPRLIATTETVKSLVLGNDQTLAWGDERGTVHLMDLKTGRELRQMGRHRYGVSDLCLGGDGKTLASIGEGLDHALHLWHVSTGKRLSPPPDTHQGRIESVAFSRDGKTLVSTSGDATLRFWDPATGRSERLLRGTFGQMTHAATFSPDGKTLAVAADGGGAVCLLDAASGREVQRVKNPASGWFTSVAFSPDGKTLLIGGNRFNGTWQGFYLWDARTARELRQFKGHTHNVKSVAFSPDGKLVASGAEDRSVRLWDPATGKEVRRLTGHQHWVETVAFSADGEVLASADSRSIRLWAPATGKEVRCLDCEGGVSGIAFSPDGKTLASGEYEIPHGRWLVRLREVATGEEIRRWAGHRNTVSSLAFSPDGRTLASGGWDTLILVWDVTGLLGAKQRAAPLTGKELDELWGHLAGTDVPQAYRAVWKLAAAPAQAVPFLAERLRPAVAVDARRVARLVKDLDSDRFAVREAATADLEQLGEGAAPALRKALDGQPSLEVRRRVQRLLGKPKGAARMQEQLRLSRALQALEHGRTAAARRLLERLAAGAAESRQSREAKAALGRLARQ